MAGLYGEQADALLGDTGGARLIDEAVAPGGELTAAGDLGSDRRGQRCASQARAKQRQ